MTTFDLIPAIDLRGGRVVRLRQGDFDAETAFSSDPVAVAEGFVALGASWLHVVDLDGARTGRSSDAQVVRSIVGRVGNRASVEVAGGLRTAADVASILDAGTSRAVVGTAALADPAFAAGLIRAHGPERIAVALDVRDGLAVGQGWVRGTPGVKLKLALGQLVEAGVRCFEVTAIDRDGTLGGPDLALLRAVTLEPGPRIIAAGGIATVDHILAVREAGCHGAIVGRALYDGTLRLDVALAAL